MWLTNLVHTKLSHNVTQNDTYLWITFEANKVLNSVIYIIIIIII